jgi:hypothetical protein
MNKRGAEISFNLTKIQKMRVEKYAIPGDPLLSQCYASGRLHESKNKLC